jgi:hypothetical protein
MARDDAPEGDDPDRDRLSEAKCGEVFERLFPSGLAGPDVLEEISPEGWENSPLIRVFHPTAEQIFEELTASHENLEDFRLPGDPVEPPPTLEEAKTASESYKLEVSPEEEWGQLVGLCLWDLFSDNHDVTCPDGRVVHPGSFRGAAGFIADLVNREFPSSCYNYIDFYMGTGRFGSRADLSGVYRMIFQRMRSLGLDWIYRFPRLGVVAFGDLEENESPIETYDPSESLKKEEDKRHKAEELAKLQADLEEDFLESVEESRKSDPPLVVRSYQDVYGHLPQGWPPEA